MTPEERARLTAELRQVEADIDAAYWRFTRCARANPPAHALYVKRNELRAALAPKAAES